LAAVGGAMARDDWDGLTVTSLTGKLAS
jgi:hypothetical protein